VELVAERELGGDTQVGTRPMSNSSTMAPIVAEMIDPRRPPMPNPICGSSQAPM